MSLLRDLALAHQTHEGWFIGSLSQRNNNPGNLRLTAYQKQTYGAVQGSGGFAKFPTYAIGFQALMDDIRAKLTGGSAHINYAKKPTFLDYVKVYAPAADGNDPKSYAQAIVRSIASYNVSLATPLSDLARWIALEDAGVAIPSVSNDGTVQTPKQRLDAALMALNRPQNMERRNILTRLVDRLKRIVGLV